MFVMEVNNVRVLFMFCSLNVQLYFMKGSISKNIHRKDSNYLTSHCEGQTVQMYM